MENGRFDEPFTQIAGQAGGIKPLLDSFFGFLQRKTDFYVEFENKKANHKMGFPKGEAERMLLKAFRKYEFRPCETDFVSEDITTDTNSTKKNKSTTSNPNTSTSTITSVTASSNTAALESLSISSNQPSPTTNSLTEGAIQIPIGNGGIGTNYYWTQTLQEVSVYIDVKQNTKSKAVSCTIQPKALQLEVEGIALLSGTFEDTVKSQECMWTLCTTNSNECPQIIITLEKVKKTWWKSVLVGHPQIDTSKVSCNVIVLYPYFHENDVLHVLMVFSSMHVTNFCS